MLKIAFSKAVKGCDILRTKTPRKQIPILFGTFKSPAVKPLYVENVTLVFKAQSQRNQLII